MKADRMEAAYTEALASIGAPKNICAALEGISQILLENLEARVRWKINDAAARNPRQPIILTEEMAELERIGRINTALASPRLDGHQADPNAGAAAIVKMLQLAREEYSNVKEQEKPKAGEDEVPPEAGEDEAGDESRQTTTQTGTDGPPNSVHRIIGRGLVRRGSG